ncbi:MAG: alpha/beta hydrolase [Gammaproteobacteria bacterium]|nr:alpha/beta hydrolase [Gammaproteobacteria bacterium]
MNRQSLIFYTILFLAGCASLPDTSIRDIQNRKVAYAGKGEGSPIIVLESGMGPSMTTWAPIFENLSQITRVFAYNRPGYGRSTLNKVPTTARELAEQLHQNLISTGHAPPYLLVGHSAGGLYVNVFARMYPEEVVGVVLIDSTHPSQFEYFRKERPVLHTAFITTTAIGNTAYEASILKNIHTEFASIEPFPNIPLVVLTAEKSSLFETAKMRKKWVEFQEDLANMSTHSTHKVVLGSGHFIHKDNPQLVIEEITRLISGSKNIQ